VSALTRDRLVAEALALVEEQGLEALSMRALAERLDVKAASLYWHVRDREELLQLLADELLDSTPRPRAGGDWRAGALAIGRALTHHVAQRKDAGRIVLEAPDALARSDLFADLAARLRSAGLGAAEARDVALMLITHAIATPAVADEPAPSRSASPASLAIDTGSRGVVVRAGPADMQTLIRVPADQAAAAPAVVRGESVVVRRLRGVGHGVIELNPRRAWRFRVQAPTWKTVLEVGGIDMRELHVDSGATKLECFLGEPRGVVPIQVSGGVAGVTIHRPRGAAVIARVSSGAVKIALDDFSARVTVTDVHWQSEGAAQAADRYELTVSSGAVKVTVDEYRPKAAAPAAADDSDSGGDNATAIEILLDGVAARIAARGR